MEQYSPQGFRVLPTVVKHLLIINVLMYLATWVLSSRGIDLESMFALYFFKSEKFHIWQYLTYMFMHANVEHLFFNMFALWMFGYILENYWGSKRFLLFYIVCGLGAAFVHTCVTGFSYYGTASAISVYAQDPNPDAFVTLFQSKFEGHYRVDVFNAFLSQWRANPSEAIFAMQSVDMANQMLQASASIPTVGASGAIYGILLAFGMMFPNQYIYLYFLLPIKAKWFVVIYIAIELLSGVFGTADGVAHFAHLGGMLFGYILIKYWKKREFQQWS
ncbi:MAG: rhomboid family intramembrane serine protease [Bacteroidales bacterium]|nr:rhomboid family intramembrane serine protease [Bacteroidales bacterium]